MTMDDTSYCLCFLILLISCWVVAASHMAEKTSVGMAVFIADITYVWFRVGWSCCPPFCVLVCLLLQPLVSLPLSRGVVSEHSSTLCDQLQGPPRTYCRCRQPSCLLCRHLCVAGEGGRWFSFPMHNSLLYMYYDYDLFSRSEDSCGIKLLS